MSEKFDKDLFEKVFCVNTIFDQQYATSVAEHFNPIFFNDTNIGIVLKKVVNFLQEKSVLPNTTELKLMFVSDADKKALMSVLQDIKDMDKTYNQDELYENTELFLRERAVYNSLLKVVDIVKSNNVDPNAILDEFTASCNISLVDSLGFDYLYKIDEHTKDLTKPNNTIPTGFKWLDDRICGGWQTEGKALYVFSGFTNVGKSIFLQHVSMAGLRANKNVLLISLEMSEHMYSRRISANISQIAYNNLPNYIDDLKASVVQLRDSLSSKIIIKEFPTKSVTVAHINAFIRKLIKKGFKPDMIVLDYLNLLKSAKTHNGTYDEVKHIAEQLRASTYLFKVPIITATQLNRKGAGKDAPGMDATSESIGLPFTVDAQFSIWASDEDKQLGITHMGIQKSRFGVNYGHTNLKIVYETMTIEEFPENVTTIDSNDINSVDSALDDFNKKVG